MYESKDKPQVNENKPQVYVKKTEVAIANVDRNNNIPQRRFTRLINTIDNILNVLLKEELIELPLMVEHHFYNGILKNYRYEKNLNYHRTPRHLTRKKYHFGLHCQESYLDG